MRVFRFCRTLALLVLFAATSGTAGMADFTFSLGDLSVSSTLSSLNVNDAGNSAGVTSGLYSAAQLVVDWTAGTGGPWSSEARAGINGLLGVAPSLGAGNNELATTLTWNGLGLGGLYDPSTDGTLTLDTRQAFAGSNALWSNAVLTLIAFVPPPPPTVIATHSLGRNDPFATTTATLAAGEIAWVEINYDGGPPLTFDTFGTAAEVDGGIDDTEIGLYDANGFLIASNDDSVGLLSALSFDSLDAGQYFLALGAFNTIFGATDFNVTSTSALTGSITLNVTAVPEPASFAVIGLTGAICVMRRRKMSRQATKS